MSDEDDSDVSIRSSLESVDYSHRLEDVTPNCICIKLFDIYSLQMLFDTLLSNFSNAEHTVCVFSCIERSFNLLLVEENVNNLLTSARVMFVDLYYRFRHDFISKLFMKTISESFLGTDRPFSDFGIDSQRTPDFIIEKEGNMYIFEITVSSSEERSLQSKGSEKHGFKPKYEREINQMRKSGHHVEYVVLHFNMSDPDSSDSYNQILDLGSVFDIDDFNFSNLKFAVRNFSRITMQTKFYLSVASSLLFTDNISVISNHENLEFLYNKVVEYKNDHFYKDFNVSYPVYTKINNIWPRILNIKNRSLQEGLKFVPLLDMADNKLKFEISPDGIDDNELSRLLLSNDKLAFFDLLKLRVGGRIINATNTNVGVNFINRVNNEVAIRNQKPFDIMANHDCEYVYMSANEVSAIYQKYSKITDPISSEKWKPVYYNIHYEDLLIKSMCNFDEQNTVNLDPETFKLPNMPRTLASYDMNLFNINDLKEKLVNLMLNANDFDNNLPVKVQKMKSSFVLPLSCVTQRDRVKLEYKPVELILSLLMQRYNIGEYTMDILNKTLQPDYNMYTKAMQPSAVLGKKYKDRYELSNKMTSFVKKFMKGNAIFNKSELQGEDLTCFNNLRKEISSLSKDIKITERTEGVKKDIGLIKINCSPKSLMKNYFKDEMKHFKDKKKQSTVEGIGLSNMQLNLYQSLYVEMESLIETFTCYNGVNDDFLIDENVYDDVKMLKDLKNIAINDKMPLINEIKDSCLGHSAAFVSRYAHSLMYYSQLPFNNNYIRVDNLGYSNVLLIIRGGSKIFKTSHSKLHRLLFPVNDTVSRHYVDEKYGRSNFKLIRLKNENYILTPWIMLNENVLIDSISFYPRVISFCSLNLKSGIPFKQQFHTVFINVLLSFHNRRKTEDMLANLRYILLSTMGDFTAFEEIFYEFIGFNYDKVQAYLRLSIIENYGNYFENMVKIKDKSEGKSSIENSNLKNIFTKRRLETVDELALMIYSTFLMTKAPYQRPVERAKNLSGILKIHNAYDKEVGLNLNSKEQLDSISVINKGDYREYAKNLIEKEFALDPYYCTQVGIFADSFFISKVGVDELNDRWIKICNRPWDSMATTTGLRGNLDNNFFGQKGYFVIYDEILNNMDYKTKIFNILFNEHLDNEKSKMIQNLNLKYRDSNNITPKTLIYHAVDKRQWRGGREIYVMDMETKRMQQPIEKYMAYLCQNTDTELISVPADKRTQVIHHSLFERDIPDDNLTTWFLTLDCSKWAPKSIFVKFALMIIPMTCIPYSFKIHFLNYLSLLYTKRLYFNKPEVKVLTNNNNNNELSNAYLIEDDKVNGFYMFQPYSWVMGIFNYTSSLMHAFNQKYCSYLLKKTTLLSFNQECSLQMYAHSDDSGGRIGVSCKPLLVRSIFFYEINLKACNHILSKKKCVISKIYFEILSIMYIFKSLLALLPKFLGGVRFLPTDKGPCGDMLQSYSKCTEIMIAGADFSTAYLYMKFFSAEIWRFYHNSKPTRLDYSRPLQYLGMPDAHPIMILMSGSDSDIIRICNTANGFRKIITLIKLSKYIDLFETDDNIIKSFKVEVKVRNINKKFLDSLELYSKHLESWSLMNINFKTTALNSLSFLKKLSDPGFKGTLVNETESRRMSRAYYFRSGEAFLTKFGGRKLNDLMQLIYEIQFVEECSDKGAEIFNKFFGEEAYREFCIEIDPENITNSSLIRYFNDIYSGFFKLSAYLDKMNININNIKMSRRTLKPTHMQIVKFGKGFTNDFDPAQLVSYIYEKEWRWALPNVDNLMTAEKDYESLMNHLGIDKSDLNPGAALKLIRSHTNKSVKDIYLYSCIPSDLKIIKNYSGVLSFLATNSFHDREIQGMVLKLKSNISGVEYPIQEIDEESYTIATQLDVLQTIGQNMNLINVRINKLDYLKFEGGSFEQYLDFLRNKRFSDNNYSYYSHHIKYLELKYILWGGNPTGEIFNDSAYYIYLKEQKFRGSWYGNGEIFFYDSGTWMLLFIYNNYVMKAEGNLQGKIDRRFNNFICDTLQYLNIESYLNIKMGDQELDSLLYVGLDLASDPSIDNKYNMRNGVAFKYTLSYPKQLISLKSAKISYVKENLFLAETEESQCKVYTLQVNRQEIIPIIKTMINEDSVKDYLELESYSSFMEFVYQNVLSNYGAEYYISLNDMKDNFNGTELYRMIINLQLNDPDYLPRKFITAKLPAPKGSLLRMMLQQQNLTKDEILKSSKELSPSIMAIRNEYPESFSAILHEKMQENFNKLYDNSELLLMHNEFVNATLDDNPENIKNSVVKLMCYWGYTGLVNVLQNYTFRQSINNHNMFNLKTVRMYNLNEYSNCFITLMNAIFKAIGVVLNSHKKWDYKIPFVKSGLADFNLLKKQFSIDTVYSTYNYKSPIINIPLSLIKVLNYLCTFIHDSDFCKVIIDTISTNYPLNTLSIGPESLMPTIATFNTLRVLWIKTNSSNQYPIDPFKQVYRLPINSTPPSGLINSLNIYNHRPRDTYFHSFLFNSLIEELKQPEVALTIQGVRYLIKQKIGKLSDTEIPTSNYFTFENVLTEEYMESENYDELSSELTSYPLDEETIDMFTSEMVDPYVSSKIKVIKETTIVPVTWVILPYIEGEMYIHSKVNNISENVIILSNCVIRKFNELRCNSVYEVDYSKDNNKYNMVAHLCTTNKLPTAFWDKYIGGTKLLNIHRHIINNKLTNIRAADTESDISQAGTFISAETPIPQPERIIENKEIDIVGEWIKLGLTETDARKMKEEKERYNEINNEIDNFLEENIRNKTLDEEKANIIKEKYINASKSQIPGYSKNIFESLLTESDLNNINNNLLSGELIKTISDVAHLKMMQCPESFGVGSYHNKPDSKSYKNLKFKAEIDSIQEGLADMIASSTLYISPKMLKICKVHYNTWRYATNSTKHKIEMKKFFLNVYLSIINTAICTDSVNKDNTWQNINDNFALIIGDEPEDDDIDLSFRLPSSSNLRMKYKAKGFE